MIIKAVARRPWGDREHRYNCWYEPFDTPQMIQQGVDFALSQAGVTGLCTTGDIIILPIFLEACQRFTHMDVGRQETLIAATAEYEASTIFA
jgi:hypothetical protein